MTDLATYQDPLVIQRLLHTSKTIAVVGLSSNELRASYFVGYYLKRHGYQVIPVNPRETKILGETCYPRLQDVPVPVDIVNVFRAPEALPGIARDAVAIQAGALWCQFGVINEEGRGSQKKVALRSSWTGASRSSMLGTSAGCTGSVSTRNASRRYGPGCNSATSAPRPAAYLTPRRGSLRRSRPQPF